MQESWENFIKQRDSLVGKTKMAEYEAHLASMHVEFSAQARVMCYVEQTWLIWKERFVVAFLQDKKHYGPVTTSRVKSSHAAVKKRISVSTGNLLTVEVAVKLSCDGQLAAIIQENARHRAIADTKFGLLISQVMGKISVAGLRGAHWEYRQRYADGHQDGDRVTCLRMLTSTMGYPYHHAVLGRTEPLSVADFDNHW